MKLKNLILAATVAFALAVTSTAHAQGYGADVFGSHRTVVMGTTGVRSGGTSGNITNNPVDIRGFEGVAKVDFIVTTNSGGGTLTATIETSPDTTNWTAIANYALATSATQISTNTYYGSSLFATNTLLLPGVTTTPTAATAGFATPYLAPAAFTNTGAVTVSAGGVFSIGFVIQDQPRYAHVVWTPGGTVTNYGGAAVLTAKR